MLHDETDPTEARDDREAVSTELRKLARRARGAEGEFPFAIEGSSSDDVRELLASSTTEQLVEKRAEWRIAELRALAQRIKGKDGSRWPSKDFDQWITSATPEQIVKKAEEARKLVREPVRILAPLIKREPEHVDDATLASFTDAARERDRLRQQRQVAQERGDLAVRFDTLLAAQAAGVPVDRVGLARIEREIGRLERKLNRPAA